MTGGAASSNRLSDTPTRQKHATRPFEAPVGSVGRALHFPAAWRARRADSLQACRRTGISDVDARSTPGLVRLRDALERRGPAALEAFDHGGENEAPAYEGSGVPSSQAWYSYSGSQTSCDFVSRGQRCQPCGVRTEDPAILTERPLAITSSREPVPDTSYDILTERSVADSRHASLVTEARKSRHPLLAGV